MKPPAKPNTMTVGQLITELQTFASDRIVILSKDIEGNAYSPLYAVHTGAYKAETTYSGQGGLERLTDELKKQGYDEEDIVDGMSSAILYPVS